MVEIYEVVLIYPPNLSEESMTEEVKKLENLIVAKGGKIEKIDRWGLRKLAYPLQRLQQGYYVYSELLSSASVVADLNLSLRQNETILRFMIVKKERQRLTVTSAKTEKMQTNNKNSLPDGEKEKRAVEDSYSPKGGENSD